MTDRPYTDADLRTEAARQLFAHRGRQHPNATFAAMLDALIESTRTLPGDTGLTWDEALECRDLNTPATAIHKLIEGAADVSAWAVGLGADGLEPDGHTFQLGASGPGADDEEQPFVRLHFAFHPDATDDERDRFVMRLAKVIAANL